MLTAVVCSAPRRSAADSRCWDAAMGTSLPAAHKYFEDKGSIELNDMYFLWRLQQRAMANLHGI